MVGEFGVDDNIVANRTEVILTHQQFHASSATAVTVSETRCTGDTPCPAEIAADLYWQYGDSAWTLDNTGPDFKTLYVGNETDFTTFVADQAARMASAVSAPTRMTGGRKRDGGFVKNRIAMWGE